MYDRGYAPQLEVLEVIHPAFVFLPCPGASRTRDILARFTRGTSLPLNRVVHFPCKGGTAWLWEREKKPSTT
jgi:hypothetical protein